MEKFDGEFCSDKMSLFGINIVKGTFSFVIPKDQEVVTITTKVKYTGVYQPLKKSKLKFTYNRNTGSGKAGQTVETPELKGVHQNQTIDFKPTIVSAHYMSGTYSSDKPHDVGKFTCRITDVE